MYDGALPEVYGYLVSRCGNPAVAEDLTSETFMAAVDAVRRGRVPDLTMAWLVGVARHKLVDHWRMLSQPIEQLSTEEYARRETEFTVTAPRSPVEPGYITMHTADAARATDFFGELFGWVVETGGHIGKHEVPDGLRPPRRPRAGDGVLPSG
jgi:DNA-directed RNA polymerase specialized sigma24 family protein